MRGRAIAALATVFLLTACGGASEGDAKKKEPLFEKEPTTFDVVGELNLIDAGMETNGGFGCWGTGGYDDIEEGAQVVIYDNAGAMIATGNLGPGEPDENNPSVSCWLKFEVPDVPIADVDLYSVEVGSRGKITFTQDEASYVGLTLGH